MRSSVLFPQPLGPMTATTSPWATSSVTSLIASIALPRRLRNVLWSPLTRTAGTPSSRCTSDRSSRSGWTGAVVLGRRRLLRAQFRRPGVPERRVDEICHVHLDVEHPVGPVELLAVVQPLQVDDLVRVEPRRVGLGDVLDRGTHAVSDDL